MFMAQFRQAKRSHIFGTMHHVRRTGALDNSKRGYAQSMLARLRLRGKSRRRAQEFYCDSPTSMAHICELSSARHTAQHSSYQSVTSPDSPGQYRVPGIDRLYLVGPFQYPGGGVFGAGRATAQVMAAVA